MTDDSEGARSTVLERTEYVENGVVQLRFADMDDSVMDLNAAEAAEVLQGMVEFTGQLARAGALGDGPPPEVRVRPPREGSSIWDFVIQWSAENPEVTTGAIQSAGAAVAGGLAYRFKMLRGARVKSFDPLPNGNMKVEWQDGEAQEVPAAAWSDFQKLNRRTKRTLQKILAPLGDDADIVQVRSGEASESSKEISEAPSVAEAGATEYRSASAAPDDEVVCQAPVLVEGRLSGVEGLEDRFGDVGGGVLVGGAECLRGEAAEGEMRSEGVEPVDPLSGRDLDVVDAAPGPKVPDDFGFEQRVQSLGQGIVVGVPA